MFKFGDYSIRREPLNFVVELKTKNTSTPKEGKNHNEYVNKHIGYYGKFRQAVNCIANYIVLNEDQEKIISLLEGIDEKLESLDSETVMSKLSV